MVKYLKDDVIKALKEAAYELGNKFTFLEYVEWSKINNKPSNTVIQKYFGSWNNAKYSAGLTPNSSLRKYLTEDELKNEILSALKMASKEIDGNFTTKKYECWNKKKRYPSAILISKVCGSWERALELANIKSLSEIKKDRILELLIEASEEIGSSISFKEFYNWIRLKDEVISIPDTVKYSWNETKNNIGIKNGVKFSKTYTDEELLEAIRTFYKENGTTSSSIYRKRNIKPTSQTILNRFGTWGNALKNAGLTKNLQRGDR